MSEHESVIYNGRVVSTEGFRVFIYGPAEEERLVNSWDEFQECISSGVWFATKEQAANSVKKESPKNKKGE